MAVSKLQRLTLNADDGASIDFELYLDDEGDVTFSIETSDGWLFELDHDEVGELADLLSVADDEFLEADERRLHQRLKEAVEDDAA